MAICKYTDQKKRELSVYVSWAYPVGGLHNRAVDNPFLFRVEKVIYKKKDVTKFLSKQGLADIEDYVLRTLVDNGIITTIRYEEDKDSGDNSCCF